MSYFLPILSLPYISAGHFLIDSMYLPFQFLNTVIPYEKKTTPPSVDDLQMLTKILYAMKEDSEKVPTLLTDYILKVLCPT